MKSEDEEFNSLKERNAGKIMMSARDEASRQRLNPAMIAAMSGGKISRASAYRIMAGEQIPSVETAELVCTLLGIKIETRLV